MPSVYTHDIGKSPFSTGNTSSNGGFSIVIFSFFFAGGPSETSRISQVTKKKLLHPGCIPNCKIGSLETKTGCSEPICVHIPSITMISEGGDPVYRVMVGTVGRYSIPTLERPKVHIQHSMYVICNITYQSPVTWAITQLTN